MTALYCLAGLGLAAVVGARLLRKRATGEELLLGAAAIGVGLTFATAAWLPGGLVPHRLAAGLGAAGGGLESAGRRAGVVAVAVTAGWLAVPVLGNLVGKTAPGA